MDTERTCEQFIKKTQNAAKSFEEVGLTSEQAAFLKLSDFVFKTVDQDDRVMMKKINQFICDNEYLGKPHKRTTHAFVALYKEFLVGVITFSTPNSFSYLLGRENRDLEKLISRGATSAVGCKNLGSMLNSYALNWMVQNTEFRVFTAYSDPEARELGTIYKALNFIYLGRTFGTRLLLRDPDRIEKGWFSDREARKLSNYKRLAKKIEIKWQYEWSAEGKINWKLMPVEIEQKLRQECKSYIEKCEKRVPALKAKWLYIKGRDKRETKQLIKKFKANNPKLIQPNGDLGFPYPLEETRGIYE
jgi:hypothetical protein